MPDCPDYLDDIAKAEWADACQQLADMRLLSKADKTALEMYCTTYSRWRIAQREVQEHGAIMLVGENDYPQKTPFATECDQMQKLIKAWLQEFAMTPASRAKLRTEVKKEETKTGTAAFFNAA